MRYLGRGLLIVGVVIVVLALIVGGAGAWFVRRPWPQVQGSIEVAGLSQPVQVIRDDMGVPHIYAENEYDLFFAQGYVHAQDRLWQMEFNRRIGSGTLSEALGESTLATDRFLRTVGLRRSAQESLAQIDPTEAATLQAYADGINAYIDSRRGRLPLEFTILGVEPEPWTPLDTVTWGQVMALQLSNSYGFELLRAGLIAELGEQAAHELMPPYAQDGPFVVPPEMGDYAWLRGAQLDEPDGLERVMGKAGPVWGSNNWVVSGSRTATGSPLLANDMHLSLNMPSIWYENGLHGGRFDVVGYTFPGVPAVVVGYNERIAWAVTNLPADVQDLYVEKLDDLNNPTRYEFKGEWRDLEIVEEVIKIKDGEAERLNVLLTHHGPILNDVVDSLADAEPMAFRWTGDDGNRILKSVMQLNLAGNWDEFQQALHYWDVPCQNFVYADREGNIGYQMPCQVPIRDGEHLGMVPAVGWDGEHEWLGTIPFDELPSVLNPERGFLVSANNKVVSDDYVHFLGYEWAAPYRAQRITDLLAADDTVTVDDMSSIHAQTYSLPAEILRPYLLAASGQDEAQQQVLDQMVEWDLCSEADCTGASVYQTWYWFLVQNTLRDELGDELGDRYMGYHYIHVPMMVDLMAQPDSVWFDDVNTPEVESRDDIIRRSLADTIEWLNSNLGDNPEEWEWGKLHSMTFVHQPLGQSGIGLLEKLFNSQTLAARGDNLTVNAASYPFNEPFAQQHGVSQRIIVDLGNLDSTLSTHSTGQSEHLLHPHREDMIQAWQNVEYHPLVFDRAAVEARAKNILTLTPP